MSRTPSLEMLPGVRGRADGLLVLEATRSLLVADAHFGYEEVVGGALPLLSLAEAEAKLRRAIVEEAAAECVFLGDVVHGPRMSRGAAARVGALLAGLRELAEVICVAGNHEGRGRGRGLLGETREHLDRAGWRLVHGDKPVAPEPGRRGVILGHLHPAIHLGAGRSAPVFVHTETAVVVPALTPYSSGLDVRGRDAAAALGPWLGREGDATVTAVTNTTIRRLGTIGQLRQVRFELASPRGR